MFCGYWTVVLSFTAALAGVFTQTVRIPPPTLKIIKNGNDLLFQSSPPNSIPGINNRCWKYMFVYSKCNGKESNVTATNSWTASVQYDVACRYAVKVQAIFEKKYCGNVYNDSEISDPVYFGENSDPDLPFKMAMIAIPLILCSFLVVAILLFRRYKETFLPKVPSPSHFFKDMFDNNTELTKGLYVGELYVPYEEVVEQIHVEPNILINKK